MNVGCRSFKKGDIVKGLLITTNPYKMPRDKNYRSIVKCTLCDSAPYEIVLSEISRHVFDGCGCQTSRVNSSKWKSFEDWCRENNREDILDLWDYDLNDKLPSQVSCCTSNSYYLKCVFQRHESELHKISYLTTKFENKKLCSKCNSFAQYAIDKFGEDVLDVYWDYDKNTVDPWEISHSSKNKIWIKCIKSQDHESYQSYPHLFLKGIGCPICADEQQCSKLQEKISGYLVDHLHFKVKHERQCSIVAINPKNGYRLPYDNDVVIDNQHLIIEVHGEQHYNVNNGWIRKLAQKHGATPEQELAELQWRDEYKKQYALSQGYHYLAIPYWTEQDESYKTLIDEKIQQILNNTKLIQSK